MRKTFIAIPMALLLVTSVVPFGSAQEREIRRQTTYLGYNPVTGQNNLEQGIIYQFPDPLKFGPGPYPLFVWTPGTFQPHWHTLSLTFVDEMAGRGFVAASVQYANNNFAGPCSGFTARALSIYETTRASSGISVLCSIPGVMCGKGVVTAGLSQGGAIAILARNYAADVRAAFAMSISDYNLISDTDLSECMDDPFTTIPAERVTIVNAEHDVLYAGQIPLMNVSGYACPIGAFECWSPTGSGAGWYIVQDWQMEDNSADHCYPLFRGCLGVSFDSSWYTGTYNWSLKPNLDWLSTFGTQRIFQ